MLQAFFHAWERRLASVSKDRVVRPFEWGLDWIPQNGHGAHPSPADAIGEWVSHVMTDTDRFFTPPQTEKYRLSDGNVLTFPSALETPHPENNTVYCRYFRARSQAAVRDPRSAVRNPHAAIPAVLVLPQWNADPGGHVGLCRLLAWSGLSALRLSLPYHDERMPPELTRADSIVR